MMKPRFFLFMVLGCLLWAAPAMAQGTSILKLGWVYSIAFPDIPVPQNKTPAAMEGGVNLYRILEYGGDQWYRVQRVYPAPNNGWLSVPGTDRTWVNMGYAMSIKEIYTSR